MSRRLTCRRIKRTRQRRSFTYDCHVRGLLFIPQKKRKRKDFFLLPRFCFLFFIRFFLFFNFICMIFFSLFFLFGNSQNSSIVILSLSSCFTLVKHPPHNILWLTFNPYSFDIFVISTYFITTSYSIRKFMITVIPSSPSSCRPHSATTEHKFSHNLYFQASLYTNYFINILLISVPHNLNIT